MTFGPFRRLSAQTLAVLFAALLLSHLIGLAIYSFDRREAVVMTEVHDLADRMVGMLNLLYRIPQPWREDIVRESDGRTFHVMLGPSPDLTNEDLRPELSKETARYLLSQFPDWPDDRVRVFFSEDPLFHRERILRDHSITNPETILSPGEVTGRLDYTHISARLDNGTWLNLVGAIPRQPWFGSGWAWIYILCVTVGIGTVAMWLVHRVSAPLTRLARAATALGRDIRVDPLPENGPLEVVDASRAFNQMQENLRRLVDNRTQMLAAISHDLRTPVTLLRLRIEALPASDDRTTMLGTLADMESMIASVLEFSRAAIFDEPSRRVDLTALLDSICSDLADAGKAVHFTGADPLPYNCRRIGMKRAITNLIDNAVAYGKCATVSIVRRPDEIRIEIHDEGPGLSKAELEKVFLPFYRVDGARTPGSGGTGLGLSIAQAIVHSHGGRLELSNRERGGLTACIVLPN